MRQTNLLRASTGVIVLCLFAIAVCASAASQQSDPSVEQFWAKFKGAVQKADKPSVASMSQFPIEMSYGIPSIRNRTQLARRWRELFSDQANAVKCFQDSKPVPDETNRNRFTVWCKDVGGNEVIAYNFVRTRTGWKLGGLDNINE